MDYNHVHVNCDWQTVKKLAVSIDKLKVELSTSASSKQVVAASKTESQVTGSKVTGSTIIRPTKLVRTPVVTSAEVTPTVTSSAADSTRTDDKPAEAASPLDEVIHRISAYQHCLRDSSANSC